MRHSRLLALCTLTAILIAAGLVSAQTVIDNPAQSAQGVVTVSPEELWRLGGDDDDLFFGTVVRIHLGPSDNLYILDGQLSEAHIISPDGELLMTVGGEGDGPGEVRQPGDFFISDDGTVNIMTGFPGKVVRINADGTPGSTAGYSIDGQKTQFGLFLRGLGTQEGMILGGIDMKFGSSSLSTQNYYLAYCDNEGNQLTRLFEKDHVIDYSDFQLSEEDMDFTWSRMALGPDQNFYLAEARDEYSIAVMDLDGNLLRRINREYKAPPRTTRQKENATQIIDAVAKYHPAPLKGQTICKTEPAISGLTVTDDGRIWVFSGHSDDDLPAGTWLLIDVFDANGKFEKQVALEGDFNRARDAAFILPNNRFMVVTGALDAFLNQMNSAGATTEEVTPLEVICFELEM